MFFMRLRRHAKIVFLLLAIVFALTFTLLGVGTGGSFGDVVSSLINGRTSDPANALIDATKKSPKSAVAWNNLGQYYQRLAEGTNADDTLKYGPPAVDALNRYIKLSKSRSKRATALYGIGLIENYIATVHQAPVQAAAIDYQSVAGTLNLNSALFTSLLGQDPLMAPAMTIAQNEYTAANKAFMKAAKASEAAFKRWKAEVIVMHNATQTATADLTLGQAADIAGDTKTAIANYKAYLKLVPNGIRSKDVRKALAADEQRVGP